MRSTTKFTFMHRDTIIGFIYLDDDHKSLEDVELIKPSYAPFLGKADLRLMKKWWDNRTIPASRKDFEEIIREAGADNHRDYLAKNLALSVSDTYWIRPEGLNITWEQVDLKSIAEKKEGRLPYYRASTYDANASLGGQMEKFWDFSGSTPLLVKSAFRDYGIQALNEVFATELHRHQKRGIPFVEYEAEPYQNGYRSICKAFTSKEIEFVSAYEVICSGKTRNDLSGYDSFISLCVEHGLDERRVQEFMDYQTLTDFVISNVDEHLSNFGVLRDTETMKLVDVAPIFDSGNSMFYGVDRTVPYTRAELLNRRIFSFYEKEEKMLKNVHDRECVDVSLLPDRQQVYEFYGDHHLPKEKAAFIAENYAVKVQMLREFQRGKTISYYHETHREKSSE